MSVAMAASGATPAADAEYLVYIGTYTKAPESKGIYVSRFRPATGALGELTLAVETDNPSFLVTHPNLRVLYATNESSDNSGVSAFKVEANGKLRLLNRASSGGKGPCHLAVDTTGRNLLVANFISGSVAVFRLRDDGSLSEQTAFVQHRGSSVNPQWQKEPHAHWVGFSPDNRFAIITDLGLDKVMVYRFDAARGSLEANEPPFAGVPPGSGPRHFAFHPSGRFGYVLNQLKGTVTGFDWQASRGVLEQIQNIESKPKEFRGINNSAEVVVHPNGKFLYASNRGPDTIAVFSVDPAKGTLALIQQEPTRGISPRHIAIDFTGSYMFVANNYTNNVVVFGIDGQTGLVDLLVKGGLQQTAKVLKVTAPVCIRFVPAE